MMLRIISAKIVDGQKSYVRIFDYLYKIEPQYIEDARKAFKTNENTEVYFTYTEMKR